MVIRGHTRPCQFSCPTDLGASYVIFEVVSKFPGRFFPVAACDVVPHVRTYGILEDTLPVGVHESEAKLCNGETLVGGEAIPFHGPARTWTSTGPDAEWIALVCLHSGVFTRAQFCHYFNTQRMTALRFVKALVDRRMGVESDYLTFNGGGKTCRISSKGIYRALGVENIRHRRKANRSVVMRRLLSLDFVLEHPGLNWLPTEGEKVEFLEEIGLPSRLIPRRIYYGAVGAQKRYFALKLPVAGGDKTVTFAYVDPGHATAVELHSWGAAHGQLWDAIRAKGRRVEVIAIGAELDTVLRADRVLQLWATAEPGKVVEGLTVKQEISAIREALNSGDQEFMSQYGGMQGAADRYMELLKLPEAELAEGVSIDDYSTFRATRFSEPV